jgi:hypothetical protein
MPVLNCREIVGGKFEFYKAQQAVGKNNGILGGIWTCILAVLMSTFQTGRKWLVTVMLPDTCEFIRDLFAQVLQARVTIVASDSCVGYPSRPCCCRPTPGGLGPFVGCP